MPSVSSFYYPIFSLLDKYQQNSSGIFLVCTGHNSLQMRPLAKSSDDRHFRGRIKRMLDRSKQWKEKRKRKRKENIQDLLHNYIKSFSVSY